MTYADILAGLVLNLPVGKNLERDEHRLEVLRRMVREASAILRRIPEGEIVRIIREGRDQR